MGKSIPSSLSNVWTRVAESQGVGGFWLESESDS